MLPKIVGKKDDEFFEDKKRKKKQLDVRYGDVATSVFAETAPVARVKTPEPRAEHRDMFIMSDPKREALLHKTTMNTGEQVKKTTEEQKLAKKEEVKKTEKQNVKTTEEQKLAKKEEVKKTEKQNVATRKEELVLYREVALNAVKSAQAIPIVETFQATTLTTSSQPRPVSYKEAVVDVIKSAQAFPPTPQHEAKLRDIREGLDKERERLQEVRVGEKIGGKPPSTPGKNEVVAAPGVAPPKTEPPKPGLTPEKRAEIMRRDLHGWVGGEREMLREVRDMAREMSTVKPSLQPPQAVGDKQMTSQPQAKILAEGGSRSPAALPPTAPAPVHPAPPPDYVVAKASQPVHPAPPPDYVVAKASQPVHPAPPPDYVVAKASQTEKKPQISAISPGAPLEKIVNRIVPPAPKAEPVTPTQRGEFKVEPQPGKIEIQTAHTKSVGQSPLGKTALVVKPPEPARPPVVAEKPSQQHPQPVTQPTATLQSTTPVKTPAEPQPVKPPDYVAVAKPSPPTKPSQPAIQSQQQSLVVHQPAQTTAKPNQQQPVRPPDYIAIKPSQTPQPQPPQSATKPQSLQPIQQPQPTAKPSQQPQTQQLQPPTHPPARPPDYVEKTNRQSAQTPAPTPPHPQPARPPDYAVAEKPREHISSGVRQSGPAAVGQAVAIGASTGEKTGSALSKTQPVAQQQSGQTSKEQTPPGGRPVAPSNTILPPIIEIPPVESPKLRRVAIPL